MSFIKSSGLHSKKHTQKRRKKFFALLSLLIGCIVAIIVSSVYLLRSSFLQISGVVVEGATTLSTKILETKALSALEGNYLGIIPFTNILFFPKNALEKNLKDSFTQMSTISIHRDGLTKIILSIKERAPVALACAGFRDDSVDNDVCYYADKDGYIFDKVATSTLSDTSSSDFNRYYIPNEQGNIAAGTGFVDPKRFHDLQNFLQGSSKAGLAPLGVLIGDAGDYEMYLQDPNSTTTETTVYFDDKAPFDVTLSNLLAFWKNTHSKISTKTKPATALDYINLRFGKTIYYSKQ